ncbi:MAG: glycosyltransferase family 2 protein [Minisyncoccia bacterium]|jgi:glycosyltransferase involved in cell wall biosynthesis
MATPRVSVLTATWNHERVIGQAIQSVLDQTFKDWELVIVDDGSIDRTAEVVREWQKKDKRIKYFHPDHHIGRIAVVSNAGLKEARGEFVAVLDGDDWWADKRKLEKQITFLDAHQDYIGCGGGFIVMGGEGKEVSRLLKPETDEAIRRIALYANPMTNSSGIFRRERAGFYDESMPQFADWDFWLTAGTKGKLYNFPEYFLAYRMWDRGSSFVNQRQNANAAFAIFKKHKREYPGSTKAFFLITLYWCYAFLPIWFRRAVNAPLSRLKKLMFSG